MFLATTLVGCIGGGSVYHTESVGLSTIALLGLRGMRRVDSCEGCYKASSVEAKAKD